MQPAVAPFALLLHVAAQVPALLLADAVHHEFAAQRPVVPQLHAELLAPDALVLAQSAGASAHVLLDDVHTLLVLQLLVPHLHAPTLTAVALVLVQFGSVQVLFAVVHVPPLAHATALLPQLQKGTPDVVKAWPLVHEGHAHVLVPAVQVWCWEQKELPQVHTGADDALEPFGSAQSGAVPHVPSPVALQVCPTAHTFEEQLHWAAATAEASVLGQSGVPSPSSVRSIMMYRPSE